jgi:hypothetical protein
MKTIGSPVLLALLAGVLTLPASEPRYQLRSLIQNDGSLMHIRLDTETGKTWRLERFLKNRISTTVDGKGTEGKLHNITLKQVPALNAFRLNEALETIQAIMKQTAGKDAVPLIFQVPLAKPPVDAEKLNSRLVPPTQSQGEVVPPVRNPSGRLVDPTTGLPIGPLPGIRRPGIDPATGLPLRPGQVPPGVVPGVLPGGIPGLPPGVGPGGLPDGIPGIGGLPRVGGVQDATAVTVRSWRKPVANVNMLNVLPLLLNSLNEPLRCVIDENRVVLVPEAAVLTLRGGKTSRPEYEERWVAVTEPKEKE